MNSEPEQSLNIDMNRALFLSRAVLYFLLVALYPFCSFAVSTVNITSGTMTAIPIAINDFAHLNPQDSQLTQKIVSVISNDLSSSGVFRIISRSAYIEKTVGVKHVPLFTSWQQINASLLLNASVTMLNQNQFKIELILWDNFIEKKMLSETFEAKIDAWRSLAHSIADRIYNKITGYEGYFNTRIVYVAETGSSRKRIKRIAIMDQDGANHEYLTDGKDLVLTPRFSPDGTKILYLSFKKRVPQVYQMDIKTKQNYPIGNFSGMSFAPHFAPDSQKAILSIAKNGATHLYELDFKTKALHQLTFGQCINTSPFYSPDGRHIVFNSDRYGARDLFIMDRRGQNVRSISYLAGAYAEPKWSSTDYIVFTKISPDYGFTIGVMRASNSINSNNERLLASGYLVENPVWSSNGRIIAFTKGFKPFSSKQTKGLRKIYAIDFTGHNERMLKTPHDASDPDWSCPMHN